MEGSHFTIFKLVMFQGVSYKIASPKREGGKNGISFSL